MGVSVPCISCPPTEVGDEPTPRACCRQENSSDGSGAGRTSLCLTRVWGHSPHRGQEQAAKTVFQSRLRAQSGYHPRPPRSPALQLGEPVAPTLTYLRNIQSGGDMGCRCHRDAVKGRHSKEERQGPASVPGRGKGALSSSEWPATHASTPALCVCTPALSVCTPGTIITETKQAGLP